MGRRRGLRRSPLLLLLEQLHQPSALTFKLLAQGFKGAVLLVQPAGLCCHLSRQSGHFNELFFQLVGPAIFIG